MSTSPDPRPTGRGRISRARGRRAFSASLCALGLAAGLSACTIPTGDDAESQEATGTAGETPAGSPTTSTAEAAGAVDLDRLVSDVAEQTGQPVGLAVADESGVRTAGAVDTGPAWSTVKVPVAVAVTRALGSAAAGEPAGETDGALTGLIDAAVTVSDNDAAAALWARLGPPQEAARATEAVLRDGGDSATRVQSDVVREGFSAFGQTDWSLAAQAQFARALPGLEGAGPAVDAMGRISAGQDYGLGGLAGVRFKGGWGPDTHGGYQVRQFGFARTGCGTTGLAVATVGGDYAAGQRALDLLAAGLEGELACGSATPAAPAPAEPSTTGEGEDDGSGGPHPTFGTRHTRHG